MNTTDKAVEIGTYFEQFISSQVATGRFASDADVLQAGLRLLEEQQIQFNLKKSELENKDAGLVGALDDQNPDVRGVSQSVTEAMRTLASVAGDSEQSIPAIPATKGLLRSQIAAE
ncbi:putative addiction module antidote protein, CC2985 family [Cohaesibacter sp. ES.047]|uniref:ribbon-helix-helix domain-containing protein n=1 Tax=Cohaesibacter sp. ES.047 TaxID=1798205 RepID=UPI000BB6E1FF|nr:type II toxin-antitoxin system ParD family antitoxin [Cohaesibacter sp. ES.047]SNY92050.1 putative addiction module antidote protein, CC2985 family [Cohaesibacter sp. ES.047]